MKRLVLFDIDGTILTFRGSAPGPGRQALNRAMAELYGIENATKHVRVAGGTDLRLARTLLDGAGLAADDTAIARFLESYLAHLKVVVETRSYQPLGDVAGVVASLRAAGAIATLATGNVRRGAEIKLSSAGLLSAFSLDHGGFGSDAEERSDILRTAIARCGVANSAVYVVGDTEHDVAAGRAIGARVIGVATTKAACAELSSAGADAIVDMCGDALLRELLA